MSGFTICPVTKRKGREDKTLWRPERHGYKGFCTKTKINYEEEWGGGGGGEGGKRYFCDLCFFKVCDLWKGWNKTVTCDRGIDCDLWWPNKKLCVLWICKIICLWLVILVFMCQSLCLWLKHLESLWFVIIGFQSLWFVKRPPSCPFPPPAHRLHPPPPTHTHTHTSPAIKWEWTNVVKTKSRYRNFYELIQQ